MLRLGLLLLLFAITLVAARTTHTEDVLMLDGRIVGGQNADIRQYPHQISMHYRGRHRCGGSVYTPNIIITAAHCVDDTDVSLMTVVAGSTLLSEKNQELPVLKYIMHESYKWYNDYDIAILILGGHLTFDEYVQPIELVTARPPKGAEVTVTGWGALVEDGSIPDHLQQVHVNYIEHSDCKKSYRFRLTSRMLCAGVSGGGKDACQGDSGGPLIYGNKLVGVVSWGWGCARKRFPGVYASIADLRDWIEKTVKDNEIEFAGRKIKLPREGIDHYVIRIFDSILAT